MYISPRFLPLLFFALYLSEGSYTRTPLFPICPGHSPASFCHAIHFSSSSGSARRRFVTVNGSTAPRRNAYPVLRPIIHISCFPPSPPLHKSVHPAQLSERFSPPDYLLTISLSSLLLSYSLSSLDCPVLSRSGPPRPSPRLPSFLLSDIFSRRGSTSLGQARIVSRAHAPGRPTLPPLTSLAYSNCDCSSL